MVDAILTKKDGRNLNSTGDHGPDQPQSGHTETAAPWTLIDDDQDFHVKLSVDENMIAFALSKYDSNSRGQG
jgi:hypothetical protein